MPPPIPCAPRLRNATATREAMLVSARRHFARESYEQVGLRDIAGDAGVDPALVSRYFGSKEALFKAVLQGHDKNMFRDVGREALPQHLADLFMDKAPSCGATAEKAERLMILLRSSSSTKASEIVRESISEDMLDPIARVLTGDDAQLRASLCIAVMMGSGMVRTALGIDPLCSAEPAALHRRLVTLFAAALAENA